MNAHGRLIETLRNPGLVGLRREEATELINDFARELAEAQRVYARSVGIPLDDGGNASMGKVIDLIDTYTLDSEEPTA
ncbi:hypothetical protein [Streptomyces sp. NPDC004324]